MYYAVTAAKFTAEGTADILINRYVPLWGCPRSILSNNGLQFFSKLSQAVYELLGVRKIATSPYHPKGYGRLERVNHTMAQILAMVVNKLQNNWDEQLPHVEFCLQQFGQRCHRFSSQRGPHGQASAPPSHDF